MVTDNLEVGQLTHHREQTWVRLPTSSIPASSVWWVWAATAANVHSSRSRSVRTASTRSSRVRLPVTGSVCCSQSLQWTEHELQTTKLERIPNVHISDQPSVHRDLCSGNFPIFRQG